MSTTILIVQPGYEPILQEELHDRLGPAVASPAALAPGAGLTAVSDAVAAALSEQSRPLVFERQRLEQAVFIPAGPVKPTARALLREVMPAITRSGAAWTIHAYTPAPEGNRHLALHAGSVAAALLTLCRDRFSAVFRRYRPEPDESSGADSLPGSGMTGNGRVLQICATPAGIWASATPIARLSNPHPGGFQRMRFDSRAPSRSYLKIEEVFSLMADPPRPGQAVVDLGAAPGGWTFAFLKRGCRVTAVDNGPLKLTSAGAPGAELRHLRQDGITFEPSDSRLPLDWLAADMLIPPGVVLGLLRRWLGQGWARRFVVNIKLPQEHPIGALRPVEDLLAGIPGLAFQIRHLYHDRREVTAFGRLTTD